MVRAGLSNKQGAFKGGSVSGVSYIPAATVIAASALGTLPIVSVTGWWPNAGFLMLIARTASDRAARRSSPQAERRAR